MKLLQYSSILAAAVLSTSSASAVISVVGDDVVDRANVDGWAGLYVDTRAIAAPNATDTVGTITDVNFYVSGGATKGTVVLTPLLWSSSDGGANFSVAGVGTGLTGYDTAGAQSAAVSLASGSLTFDTTTAGVTYYQGMGMWQPGGNARTDEGLVDYVSGASPGSGWDAGNNLNNTFGEAVAPGDAFVSDGQLGRAYSYQSTINFVPEPSAFLFLMGAGFAGILRRRR